MRADLTMLDDFERSTTVAPGRAVTHDFSLVRTGRVAAEFGMMRMKTASATQAKPCSQMSAS